MCLLYDNRFDIGDGGQGVKEFDMLRRQGVVVVFVSGNSKREKG